MELLAEKIAYHSHSNWISIRNKSDRKHRYLGKQVFPPALSVYQLGSDSVYNGVKLSGYRQVDADGTKPMTLPIIEEGILKNMLTGRVPTLGCPASTGIKPYFGNTLHSRYFPRHVQPPRPLQQTLQAFSKIGQEGGLETHLHHKKEQNLTLRVDTHRFEHRQGRTRRRKLQLSFTRTIQTHACHFKRRKRL